MHIKCGHTINLLCLHVKFGINLLFELGTNLRGESLTPNYTWVGCGLLHTLPKNDNQQI